ncbi:drug resistance transporter, EmrB/QacA subfamily [Pseudonocardia ammonioxydans]|uniref:Drug resistance transporter, EmrB/QacA subfamily n=1 Tax=Pseudonocardia ammonioxydans TaxID=260086 RepID=A0A1I4WUH9_PSUAM|nr:MFS transporter [Pseudonocardia ammonioxydans]SFN17464.1 drug resistance transporter, EmrB/QacA subfamily [Pseudonocardia ammonioxydans]
MSTAAAGARPAAASADGELTHRQILTVLGGLMLGMFLAALDQTVVSTAVRTIADDLSGLSLQAWATTAFLITSTIATPLYGKLSDIYGRKPLFMIAISIFLVGSVACTAAWSMYSLAAFRAVQGLGAGGLMSLALTILGDIVPPRERARYQGLFLAVFGTSSVIGPVIGGLLSGVDTFLGVDGWRWIFLVNVPIGLVALVVVYKVLNIPHVPRPARIDWPGALALTLCLVPLLIVAEQGRDWGWASTSSIVCYVIGAVGLVLFLVAERAYGDDALLPLRLFRTGVFSLSSVINLLIGMAMLGGIALLPQFLQLVHGATPIEAGFMMLPMVGGIMVASVASGQLTSRTGRYKIFPVLGTAFITIAMVLFWQTLTPEIPILQLDLTMALLGLGLGLCMQTLVLAVQNAMPARDMGVTTSSVTFFRQMGGTLGTAVFLSVVFSTAGDRIGEAFRSAAGTAGFRAAVADPAVLADPANRQVVQGMQSGAASSSVLSDSSFLQRIDPRLAAPFQEGFTSSMTLAFLVAACVIAVAFVLVLFLKELPLRTMSGAQAARAEAEAEARASLPTGDPVTAAPVPAPAGRGGGHEPAAAPVPVDPPTAPLATVPARGPVADESVPADRAVHGGPERLTNPADAATAGGPGEGAMSNGTAPDAATAGGPGSTGPAVAGRVRDEAGTALPGVTVTVARLSGEQIGRTVTDDDGHYHVAVHAPGTYLVVAASGSLPPHAATVGVGTGTARHDARLAGGSGVRGAVRDAGGQGVAGLTVSLIDAGGDVAASGRTGEAGRFVLTGVPEGRYTLTAVGEAVDPVAVGVEVPAVGAATQDLRLPQRARLTGRVTAAPDGLPVNQALATLIDADGAVVGSRLSGPDGTFTFDRLQAGSYTLATSGYPPVATVVALESGRVTHSDVEFPHPLDEPGSAPAPSPADNGRVVREGDPR